jgi:raffinose/stachyose/melibiose transport system permease protein
VKKLYQNKLATFLFLLPALILIVGILVIPIIMSAYYSLQDWDGITSMKFVGLENYMTLFTSASKAINFPQSLGNAVLFALASVFIQLPLSLFIALILARKRWGSKAFLSIYFIPVLLSTVVIGQLWLKIYNPEYGILNVALRSVGLESWTRMWLGDKATVLLACFVPILWQYTGYHMLLMYAGVNSVPLEMQEAALIDGATEWQINTRIIIPMIKPVLRVCIIISVTGSLKVFDLIFVLTGGGPNHASEVPSTLLYNMLFLRNDYGTGSAIAILLIALCFLFAVIIRKAIRTEAD